MFTASHNPASYNGIKLCRAGRQARSASTPGCAASGTAPRAYLRRRHRRGRAAGRLPRGGRAGRLRRRTCAALVDLSGIRPLKVVVDAGNGMGGLTVPAVLGQAAGLPALPIEVIPLYFELDGTFPNHEANPLEPANLRRPAGGGRRARRRHRAGLRRRRRPLLRRRRARRAGEPVRGHRAGRAARDPRVRALQPEARDHGDPQPDHLPGGAGDDRRGRRRRRCAPGSATRSSRPQMAATGAIFGGEHSAHYYFRDFWCADTGMLAALHVLAALGASRTPLSELAATFTPYALAARSTPRSPTCRRPTTGSCEALRRRRRGRRARRAHRHRHCRRTSRSGGSTCARPTPSRCCGSTSRRARMRRCGASGTTCSRSSGADPRLPAALAARRTQYRRPAVSHTVTDMAGAGVVGQ